MSKKLLAHSENKEKNIPAQTYQDHIDAVVALALSSAIAVSKFMPIQKRKEFISLVEWAAKYHDLGKVLSENQNELLDGTQKHLPMPHADAGALFMIKKNQTTSCLIRSHHAGLPDYQKEIHLNNNKQKQPNTRTNN